MKVFILEDDPTRMITLEGMASMKGADFTRAISCKDVKKFQPPYDLILLDHDLGGRQMTANEDDGYNFVKLILEKIPPDTPIIVHSYNPDGAMRMIGALADAGLPAIYAPFGGVDFQRLLREIRERYYAGKLGNHLE